jgi:hypothetical protein
MARKKTEADRLAADLERQLAALNAQPSPVDVVRNITNPVADTSKPTYEGMRSQLSEIKDPKVRAAFEKAFASTDKLTEQVTTQYETLGYDYDPNTNVAKPKAPTITPIVPVVPVAPTPKDEAIINLAEEAFVSSLKLLMGSAEASKPYVKELYKLVSKYYKSGSSISDAINLALYDARENKLIPEFTNRFSGIFKLADRRAAGEMIDVPTLAEYVKSQEGLAEVFRSTNLGELATESFLNEVMGTGKSVAATTKIITDVYDAIRLAPEDWKNMVKTKMPFATEPMLAKALLLGTKGAEELEREVNRYGIMAAAQSQGLTVGEEAASELLAKGVRYGTSKPQFGRAATILPTAQKLTSMETGIEPGKAYGQEQAFSAIFDQNAAELQKLADLELREEARFAKRPGTAGSRSFASQARGMI